MGTIVVVAARLWAGYFLLGALLQATSGDPEISCKYLLSAMGGALVGTNAFWALWLRAILKEKDQAVNDRISDLRQAALKVKSN